MWSLNLVIGQNMFANFLSGEKSKVPKLISVISQIPVPILEEGLVRLDQTATLNLEGTSSTAQGQGQELWVGCRVYGRVSSLLKWDACESPVWLVCHCKILTLFLSYHWGTFQSMGWYSILRTFILFVFPREVLTYLHKEIEVSISWTFGRRIIILHTNVNKEQEKSRQTEREADAPSPAYEYHHFMFTSEFLSITLRS